MKLYEIEHINNPYNENAIMGMELRFINSISPITGEKMEALGQPDDWDHVKRLTNMLFLAWNDNNPQEGTVYLGELVTNPPNDDFYEFFRGFNGFSINEDQKFLHECFSRNPDGFVQLPRRSGKTQYLTTLSVWLKKQGKNVHYITHNHDMTNLVKRSLLSREYKYPSYLLPTISPVYNPDILYGHKIDWFICDEIGLYENRTWDALGSYTDAVKTCKQFGAYTRII